MCVRVWQLQVPRTLRFAHACACAAYPRDPGAFPSTLSTRLIRCAAFRRLYRSLSHCLYLRGILQPLSAVSKRILGAHDVFSAGSVGAAIG